MKPAMKPVVRPKTLFEKQQARMQRRKAPSVEFLAAKGNDLAFNEATRRYSKLIQTGAFRYGSRKEPFETNVHHAKLALWKTLLWGSTQDKVTHKAFLGKFKLEMQRAVGNDERGHIPRGRVSLEYWHEKLPDPKTSLNMHLMGKSMLQRSHYRSNVQSQIRATERRKRYRNKQQAKAKLADAVREAKAVVWHEKSAQRQHFWLGLIQKVHSVAVRKPFLFRPSEVERVFFIGTDWTHGGGRRAVDSDPKSGLLPSVSRLNEDSFKEFKPFEKTRIRKLMAVAFPQEGVVVSEFKAQSLTSQELKNSVKAIEEIVGSYPKGSYPWVTGYFTALKKEILRRRAIPKVILNDLEKIYVKKRRVPEIDESQEFSEDEYPF